MQQLNELEATVAAVKAQLVADQEELAQWEADTAAARNRGLFFQTLHKPDVSAANGPNGRPGKAPAPSKQV